MASTSSCPSSSSETTMTQRRPSASDAAVAITDESDGVPFLGTPYASNQRFDYPFPVNCLPPDPFLGPQKLPSALPISPSLMSASSLVQHSDDTLASLPSVMSSLGSNPEFRHRAGSIPTDRAVLRHSRSNSSLISARSTKSLQSLSQGSGRSQGSGSSSPSTHTPPSPPSKPPSLSSRESSPNGCHSNLHMTLATAPSLEPRSVGVTPQRPKPLTLTLPTNQASKSPANPVSSGSSHWTGIGSLSSLSFTSITDDKHVPPTLRSKLQRTGALVVASHDALPKEASANATPPLKVHDPPAQSAILRSAPLSRLKRPLPVRAYSHASSFLRKVPGPIPESDESMGATPPSPTTGSPRSNRQASMKRVIKKTASLVGLVELGLEGLKRAASGGSKRSRTRPGSRTHDATEASGDSSRTGGADC